MSLRLLESGDENLNSMVVKVDEAVVCLEQKLDVLEKKFLKDAAIVTGTYYTNSLQNLFMPQ